MMNTSKILTFILIFLTFCNSQQKGGYKERQFVWTEGTEPQNEYQCHIASSTTDKVFVIGGYRNDGAFEVYSPKSDNWSTLPPLPTPRAFLSGTTLDNSLYVIGGINDSAKYSSTVEQFDFTLNKWNNCKDSPVSRSRMASVGYDGKIYVIGGLEGTDDKNANNSTAVERYDPATDSWTRKTDMPTPRHGHAAIVVNDKILVVGGYTDKGPTGIVEVYDPEHDKWTTKSEMPTPRGFFGLVRLDKYIYAIAGRVRKDKGPIERYDFEKDSWIQLDPMPEWRNRFGITALDNKVYIIGGERNPKSMLIGELRK